jgi:3-oxoacyl-(acyl-carrier-protein) synthase III
MAGHRLSIAGIGYHLPERVITNEDIVSRVETSAEFIETRTGVLERRHVDRRDTLMDLIREAATAAIEDAGLTTEDIDMLIVNSLTPDHHDPSQACLVQDQLELRQIPCFDIRAQCTGLIYGMDIASQYIETGKCRHVLVVCAEMLSKRLDTSNRGRNVSILLGDGAGAVVFSATPASDSDDAGLISVIARADGSHYFLMYTIAPGAANSDFLDVESVRAGEHHFLMQGRPFADQFMAAMTGIVDEMLTKHNLSMSDIDLVISHQPNLRLLERMENALDIPSERLVKTVDRFGNMASASLPVTLGVARDRGLFEPGSLCLLLGAGSGMTWGAALYRF